MNSDSDIFAAGEKKKRKWWVTEGQGCREHKVLEGTLNFTHLSGFLAPWSHYMLQILSFVLL